MRTSYPLPLALALEEGRRSLRRRAGLEGLLSGLFAGGLLGGFLSLVLLLSALLWGEAWPGRLPLILGLGPLVLGGILGAARGYLARPSDLETALAMDREAGLPDRISTALEFWLLEERTPFQEAAVMAGLDAAVALDPVELFSSPGAQERRRKKAFLAAGIALAASLAATFLPPGPSLPGGASPSRGPASLERASSSPSLPGGRKKTAAAAPLSPPGTRQASRKAPSSAPQKEVSPDEEERNAARGEKTRAGKAGGAGGAGRAGKGGRRSGRVPSGAPRQAEGARTGSSAGASGSTGSPGGGAGKPGKRKSPPPPGKRKKKGPGKPPSPAKGRQGTKTPLSGGAMAAGTSRMGGNFSPVTHSWKTMERGGEEDSGGEDQDQEVDEEKRRSRQRGGTQPSLRDRRPPPSRDLGLSQPGDQPGKGRGGPTPPKKDRGTAALILGLPLPDTIKGLPNPGTSRVEQERTSPREAPVPPGAGPGPSHGEGREPPLPAGSAPAGESGTVERYFEKLRGGRGPAPKGAGR